jgi:hypothetical protein
MSDKSSLMLSDVLSRYTEVIEFFLQTMRCRERPHDHQMEAAQRGLRALDSYVGVLNVAEIQRELEQTRQQLAAWRNSVPDEPFEDHAGGLE